MYIESVEVGDFRNYEKSKIVLHPNVNIIYGDNAQGKTNILEAIYVCSTSGSHKGSRDRELIRMGKDEAHIKMNIKKSGVPHRIDMHLKKNRSKGIAIDGIPIRKSGELMGLNTVVIFSPEDLRIVKNGPAERRRFMNMELCQIDNIYLHNLSQYNKIIKQRNNLLKQIYYKPSLKKTLFLWDEKLVEYGKKIISGRKSFIKDAGKYVRDISEKLTGSRDIIDISYEPNVEEEEFEIKLKSYIEKDCKMYSTGVGPHKDDFKFINKNMDIRKYGSQGQQRTAALSLKLAEIEIIKKITGHKPVLLLDDVLSELDRKRQNFLLDSINEIQTIITCTGLEEFIDSRLSIDRIFRVTDGNIILEK